MHEKENLISFQTRVILGMRTGLRRSSIPHLKELLNKRVPTNTQSQAV